MKIKESFTIVLALIVSASFMIAACDRKEIVKTEVPPIKEMTIADKPAPPTEQPDYDNFWVCDFGCRD